MKILQYTFIFHREEERKTAEQAAAEEAAKQQTINSASMSQRNALEKAKDYLEDVYKRQQV